LENRIIKEIKTGYYLIPLDEPLVDAEHGSQANFEIITATIILEDGSEGTGYTYTGGYGGQAILGMIEQDLIPALIGKDATAVENLNEDITVRVNYVGRGGISSFAVAAIDIALWDLRCKAAKLPLWKFLGGKSNEVECYYGGIDLGYSQEKLLDNIKKQMAKGHNAFKIKLGKKELQEDIDRTAAVRKLIGPSMKLMVDANASWDVQTAVRASAEFKKLNILWLEEPIEARDYEGYAELNRRCEVPIAMGENLHSLLQHRYAMQLGRIDFPEPDASNLGGITGWLRVANLAKAFNLPVCTHGMQELHVSLLAAIPHAGFMEIHCFPIDRYTKRLVEVKNGIATAPDTIGIGVEFDWEKLAPYNAKK